MANVDKRQELAEGAKLAEEAERYEDMVGFMKELVDLRGEPLSAEERNLLSLAYQNAVGARRSAWCVIAGIEDKSEEPTARSVASGYKEKIEKEVVELCRELLQLIDGILLPAAKGASDGDKESVVFFLKIKADYYRYIAEVSSDDSNRKEAVEESEKAYTEGVEIAKQQLQPSNQLRLGLALNFSVFHYEHKNDQQAACRLARSAFDQAIAQVDMLESDENSYKSSTRIMQLLRDNLMLWMAEQEGGDTKDEEEKND